jgi:4'-phosphopantetheinyl transferase
VSALTARTASTALCEIACPAPWRVWRVAVDQSAWTLQLPELDEAEQARAASFVHIRDRWRYSVARAQLRLLLAEHLGMPSAALHFVHDHWGKPHLVTEPRCAFNLSHSGDVALVALANDGEIGVDIEVLRAMPNALELAQLHFSPAERQALSAASPTDRDAVFLRCWTRKEACLKAIGRGLSLPPRAIDTGATSAARKLRVQVESRVLWLQVVSLDVGTDHLAAVARICAAQP